MFLPGQSVLSAAEEKRETGSPSILWIQAGLCWAPGAAQGPLYPGRGFRKRNKSSPGLHLLIMGSTVPFCAIWCSLCTSQSLLKSIKQSWWILQCPQAPAQPRPGFGGNGGSSYSSHLSPDGYFPPLGHLLKEHVTFEGQTCEAAHLNPIPSTSLPRLLVCCVSKIKIKKKPNHFRNLWWAAQRQGRGWGIFSLPSLQRSHFSAATDVAPLYLHRDLSLSHFAERCFLCKHLFCNSLFLLPDIIFYTQN